MVHEVPYVLVNWGKTIELHLLAQSDYDLLTQTFQGAIISFVFIAFLRTKLKSSFSKKSSSQVSEIIFNHSVFASDKF